MAFRLHCDRCLRFIQIIDAKKMKELAESNNETICAVCQKSEEKIIKVIENMKSQVADRVRILEQECKKQLNEELQKVVAENKAAG